MMSFHYLFLCNSIIIILLTRFVISIETMNILDRYCLNSPTLQLLSSTSSIDGLWKLNDGNLIFIGGNYFCKINQIHKNYLPEVSEGFPQTITEDIKAMVSKAKRHPNFFFEDHIYAVIDRNKKSSYLMGFNQIWFDCPQPLCIDGGLDAIFEDEKESLFLFRGKYYWELSDETTVEISKAKLIAKEFEGIPTHLDAVTKNTDKQMTYFFKESNVWILDNNNLVNKKKISDIFLNGPDNINAAMFVKTDYNQAITYIFRGIQYWAYEMGINKDPPYKVLAGFPDFVANIHHSFPNAIDACFMNKKFKIVVFFIRWMYYSFPLESFMNSAVESKDLNRKFSFIDVFKCDQNNYKKYGFESYENFIEHFGNRSENFSVEFDETDAGIGDNNSFTELSVGSDSGTNDISFIVIIIGLIVILIAIITVISMIFAKSKSKKNRNRENSESKKAVITKSTLSDLPSREVKSIVIETNELKPIKSEVFAWKSNKPKVYNKTAANVKITQKLKSRLNQNNLKSPENVTKPESPNIANKKTPRSPVNNEEINKVSKHTKKIRQKPIHKKHKK